MIDLDDFECVGYVGVDAGCIMIVDPCYVLDDTSRGGDPAKTYQSFLDAAQGNNLINEARLEVWGQGAGIITSSGYGDGTYSVYARFEDKGMGRRVAQILIDFVSDMDEPYEEEEYDEEDDE